MGKGDGANYGGLAGADAYCQQMATAAGRGGVMWHAYLSTQGPGAVNARDRIGNGPWYNARGQAIAMNNGVLHGDTIDQARTGNAMGKQISLTEKNTVSNGVGDMPNTHDILTGSKADGTAYTDGMDHTCGNYASSATTGQIAVGDAEASDWMTVWEPTGYTAVDDGRTDGVAATETESRKSAARTAIFHRVQQRRENARAARPDWMTECDRSAVDLLIHDPGDGVA